MPHDLQKLYSTAQYIFDLFANKDIDSLIALLKKLKEKAAEPDAQQDDIICANMAMIFMSYSKAFYEPPWSEVHRADIPFELRMSKLLEIYEKYIYVLDNLFDDEVASIAIIKGTPEFEFGDKIYKFLELRGAVVAAMLKLILRDEDAKNYDVIDSYKRVPNILLFEAFVEIEQAARTFFEHFDWNLVEDRNRLVDIIYLLDNICRYSFPNLKEVKQIQQQCLYRLMEYYPSLSEMTFQELLGNLGFNSDLQSDRSRNEVSEQHEQHEQDEELAALFHQDRVVPRANSVAEIALDELHNHNGLSLESAEYFISLPGLSAQAQQELSNIIFFTILNPSNILTEDIMQNMFSCFIYSVFIFKPEVAKPNVPVTLPMVVDLEDPKNLFLFNLRKGVNKFKEKNKPTRPFSKIDSDFKKAAKRYHNFDNHNVDVLKERINFLSFIEDHISEPTSIFELLAAKYALQEAFIPQLSMDDLTAYRLKVSDYSVHIENYMQSLRDYGDQEKMDAGLNLSQIKRTYHSQLLNLIDDVYAHRNKDRPIADMKHNEDGVSPFNTRFPRI